MRVLFSVFTSQVSQIVKLLLKLEGRCMVRIWGYTDMLSSQLGLHLGYAAASLAITFSNSEYELTDVHRSSVESSRILSRSLS